MKRMQVVVGGVPCSRPLLACFDISGRAAVLLRRLDAAEVQGHVLHRERHGAGGGQGGRAVHGERLTCHGPSQRAMTCLFQMSTHLSARATGLDMCAGLMRGSVGTCSSS